MAWVIMELEGKVGVEVGAQSRFEGHVYQWSSYLWNNCSVTWVVPSLSLSSCGDGNTQPRVYWCHLAVTVAWPGAYHHCCCHCWATMVASSGGMAWGTLSSLWYHVADRGEGPVLWWWTWCACKWWLDGSNKKWKVWHICFENHMIVCKILVKSLNYV